MQNLGWIRVAGCELRVTSCGLWVTSCGLWVAGYSMLDAGYSMQTAGVYLFVGLLEFHQKLNYAFLRHRKRRSEAIPSFVVRHSSFVPPELRVTGKKGMAGRGQKTDDRSQMTADRKQMTEGFYSINENLVLWARSEIIGSASLNKEFLNPKHA